MGTSYKVIKKMKHAAICIMSGCDLELLLDVSTGRRVIFRASPASGAEHAIAKFEAGELYQGRQLLDEYSKLHQSTQAFLRKHINLS